MVIDFDDMPSWEPLLDRYISELAPGIISSLRTASLQLKYFEDHGEYVLSSIGQTTLYAHLRQRLSNCKVRFYHGTRLTVAALASLKQRGLQSLDIERRRQELEKILSVHPKWHDAKQRMDGAIKYIEAGRAGVRADNRIHFCLSRSGLLHQCNHYLQTGAEVDTHIIHKLFPDEPESALKLLQEARTPYLVTVTCSLEEAVHAMNPYGIKDEGPAFLRKLLFSWAYKKANPDFSLGDSGESAAAVLQGPIIHVDEIIALEISDDG